MSNLIVRGQFDGYHACPCRDCFEISIGTDDDGSPSFCSDCQEHGCEPDKECQSPDAYQGGPWPTFDEGLDEPSHDGETQS